MATSPAAQTNYNFIYDSRKLDALRQKLENVINNAVTDIYGDAGRTFAVETVGWGAKLHFVLKEIKEDPKRCTSLTLSEMFNPNGKLWNYLIKTANKTGFRVIYELRMGFEDMETKNNFLIDIPGAGLLRT
jgi:hypothetical protein